jgi:hypothetical protein
MKKLLAIVMCVAMLSTMIACYNNSAISTDPVEVPPSVNTTQDPTNAIIETEPIIPNYEIQEILTPWNNDLYSGVQGRIVDIYVDGGVLTRVDDVWCNNERIWEIPTDSEIVSFNNRILLTKDAMGLYIAYGYVGNELVGTEINCTNENIGMIINAIDSSSFMRVYEEDGVVYGETYVLFEGVDSVGKLMCYVDDVPQDIDLFCGEWMGKYLVVVDGVALSLGTEFEVSEDAIVFTNSQTEFNVNATQYLGYGVNHDAFLRDGDDTQIWCQHVDGDWFNITLPDTYTTNDLSDVMISNGTIFVTFSDGKYYWNDSIATIEPGATVELAAATDNIEGFADWLNNGNAKQIFVIDGELLVLMDDGIIYKIQ